MTDNSYFGEANVWENLRSGDSAFVKVGITDLDGVLRGKYLSKEKILSNKKPQFGFCNVVLGWDTSDVPFSNTEQTGWQTGFPDATVILDEKTFRQVPWDNKIPFFLGEFFLQDGTPHPLCPRQVLRRVLSQASKMGYQVLCGAEFEWFNFSETSGSWSKKEGVNPEPITPGMFGYSLLRANANGSFLKALMSEMKDFGVPIEGLHTETGPGVYEAALTYSDALEAADRAVLFKSGTKEIAHRFGIMPSFMAKWNALLPGCSGHLHQSLSDGKRNIFFDQNRPNGISSLMESYIAGQIKYMAEIGPLFWPNVNSYKRLVDGFWAPVTASWGIDDRTASLRVILGGSNSTRVETRCPGADANPYLAMAGAIAAGLSGIKEGLTFEGNDASSKTRPRRNPRSLVEATGKFSTSAFAADWFGQDFVQHFSATRNWEWEQSISSITDWELKRYLEII